MTGEIDSDTRANAKYYSDRLLEDVYRAERPKIRLLSIRPAHYGALIQGDLRTFDLDAAPSYKALSYSWGEKTTSAAINLDRRFPFHVRQNLEEGLQRLRDPSVEVSIWIDGICINQADVSERSAQVQLMGEIYSRAQEVVVWLGETRTLSDMSRFMCTSAVALARQQDKIWWKRLWVVQECALATRPPTILFGPSRMAWDEFLVQWEELLEQDRHEMSDLAFYVQANEGQFVRGGSQALRMLSELSAVAPHERKLHRMLVQTRHLVSSCEHDRIYALIHLLDPSERDFFRPNYGSPVEDLFAMATLHMINHASEGFDMLLRFWYRGSTRRPTSWWLDLAKPLPPNAVPFYCDYRTSETRRRPEIDLELLDGERYLRVQGVLLESIDTIQPFQALFEGKGSTFSLTQWVSFLQDLKYREKIGKLRFFSHQRTYRLPFRRKSSSTCSPESRSIRRGLLQSLIWIYRNHATSLSERMQRTLDTLEGIPDDLFWPGEDDSYVQHIVDMIHADLKENLQRMMEHLYYMLGRYAIFITTSGFVGFCRHNYIPEDISNEKRSVYRAPLPKDLVVTFHGGSFPFIIRRSQSKPSARASMMRWGPDREAARERFTVVDGCCLPAIMNGELTQLLNDKQKEESSFLLE